MAGFADAMLHPKPFRFELHAKKLKRGGLAPAQIQRSHIVGKKGRQNKRLKKLVAEAELDKAILKEALPGN